MSNDKNNINSNSYRPDWHPENAGDEFAIRVVKGKESTHDGLSLTNTTLRKTTPITKSAKLTKEAYIKGVLNNDRTTLARTITLIESNSPTYEQLSQEVLQALLPYSGNSLRIGITGVPGAGKSTLIETLGLFLIEKGYKVAVLAVDPSSSVTKGSILGDKTRMEKLSREADCFIRPSPSSGTLGGVTRKSRETMLVCEAAGYDVILIETVGVGQSEITVRSMVDFFLLVLIAGAGDELQGIKKGVIEIADAIAVNKADGDNMHKAKIAATDYSNALHYLAPATEGWKTDAHTCSAVTGKGIPELWNVIKKFEQIVKDSNFFERRRKQQTLQWVFSMIEEELKEKFYNNSTVKANLHKYTTLINKEEILATTASKELLQIYQENSN